MSTRILLLAILHLFRVELTADESVVGVTEPGEQIELTFPEPGVIRSLPVEEGQRIKEGDLLAQLDCRVLEAQLEIVRMRAESTAAAQAAGANLEMRKQRLSQLERLAASDRANADELARARAEHEVALADLQLAREAALEHALEARQIEAQIEQRTLRAPFDGIVARVHRDLATSVAPQDGPVLTLVQLERLDLVVHIDHRRLDGLAAGQWLVIAALDREIEATGEVAFISPVVDASSGTARVRITLENAEGQHRSGVKYRVDLPTP